MDITLIAGPNTVIEDCEDAWVANTNVTSANTDNSEGNFKVGVSVKIIVPSGAVSGQLLAYETITSKNLSQVGYIALWLKSSITTTYGQLQLVLHSAAPSGGPPVVYDLPKENIDIPALTANTWKFCILALANPILDTAIVSVGIQQVGDLAAFNLWVDEITCYLTKTFNPLSVKGVDDAESAVMNLSVSQSDLVGNRLESSRSFNRRIQIDLGVVSEKIDRIFLWVWLMSETKQITYAGETITVVLSDNSEYDAEWKNGVSFARAYSFEVIEKTARRTLPISWLDY